MNTRGGNGFGKLTQTAGTLIQRVIPGLSGCITRLTKLVYTAQGTAHVVTVMRPLGHTKLSAAASGSQAHISLLADPGAAISNAIGANDYLVLRHDDGVQRLYKVSSGTYTDLTLTANVYAAVSANRDVWFFGAVADTDPVLGEAHNSLRGVASVTSTYTDDTVDGCGLFASWNTFEPLVISSDNAAAAGTLEQCNYKWTQ